MHGLGGGSAGGVVRRGAALPGLLDEDSFYALLAEHGDRIVRYEDFAAGYSEGTGGPSIPPSLLAEVLLLQYCEGLSDERVMEAVRLQPGWKVALGLPIDHAARAHHPRQVQSPPSPPREGSAWRPSPRSRSPVGSA